MSVRLLFVHALSPLHAGTGQSVGAIELAIARDRATGFPYLPGTSLKGALRDRTAGQLNNTIQLFGPETANASDHAGAILFGDANLLLLPVRSVAGTFAWATSPYLLSRFRRDCAEAGVGELPALPSPGLAQTDCLAAQDTVLQTDGRRVVFEDLDLQVREADQATATELGQFLGGLIFPGDELWARSLVQRLCIVHDDVMAFLSEHGTDVVARVALKHDSKTVDNLWHEESLPTESVLVSVVVAAPNAKTGLDAARILTTLGKIASKSIQLGGKATVGRGRCRLVLGGAQ
jgi:CRISPR-associated protein Cmr4